MGMGLKVLLSTGWGINQWPQSEAQGWGIRGREELVIRVGADNGERLRLVSGGLWRCGGRGPVAGLWHQQAAAEQAGYKRNYGNYYELARVAPKS